MLGLHGLTCAVCTVVAGGLHSSVSWVEKPSHFGSSLPCTQLPCLLNSTGRCVGYGVVPAAVAQNCAVHAGAARGFALLLGDGML